jgi:hypothetical protein
MCMSSPKIPPPPPPPAPPPASTFDPETKAVTQAQMRKETKRRRGTSQLTVRRPSVSMGGSGGTGVQLSS